MNSTLRNAFALLVLLLSCNSLQAQIVINEFSPANINTIQNGNEFDDWIEIYNNGPSAVNLGGYGLTDDISDPFEFTFPYFILNANSRVLIFAADENDTDPVNHWETAVTGTSAWRYHAGNQAPDTNWRNLTFNENTWPLGNGGFGFGDNDDQTSVSQCAAVEIRKTFFVADTSLIAKAVFNIDFDDGYVVYLNGVEIAREFIYGWPERPLHDDFATASHEAALYQGMEPDSVYIDPVFLKSILRQGNNVLAVEVHNASASSGDLTVLAYLSFGMRTSAITYSPTPTWFNAPTEEYFTADFKLKRDGETIYIVNPSGNIADQITYTDIASDNSMGRNPDGSGNWCYFASPTPGAVNSSSLCYTGYATQPVFSSSPGFYPSTMWLTMSTTMPGGVIRYTVNGNEPTGSSPIYSSPILLNNTQVVRALVFANGYLPSPVATKSFFINENIHLSVFSISTDSSNLWDYNTGIYVMGPNADPNSPYQGANFWMDWEKKANVEYYDKSKTLISSFNADISIYGNYSRAKPQKSFEIKLQDKYGVDEIHFPLIPDKPFIDETNNIILRNSGTDWNIVHFRDAFMERMMKPTHLDYLAAEPAVMYLNGEFWGVYTINENHDHHWVKANYGLEKEEIDFMKEHSTTIEVKNGSDTYFWEMYNHATTQDPSTPAFYNYMDSKWDLENYVDYFACETYYGNGDWIGDWTNNIKFWRPQDGKLRYFLYDTDFGLGLQGNANDSSLYNAINPLAFSYSSVLFNAMLDNPVFKRNFINRYADLINTIWLPSKMLPVMHQFQDSMAYDMPQHFAKWGSTMSTWQSKINSMMNYMNARPAIVRNHIQGQFNMNSQVTLTVNVSPAGAGRILISTVIPETYPWSGVYFNGNPVTITAIPNPGYTFDHFRSTHIINPNDNNQTVTYNFNQADQITAYFNGAAETPKVVVSEINYHSDSLSDPGDWLEVHNYSSTAVDLTGWKIKDGDDYNVFEFPLNAVIPANGYLVIAEDLTKFTNTFPTVTNVIGPLSFSLNNAGEELRLFNNTGALFLSFFYQDNSPWPLPADGLGYTCEFNGPLTDPNDGNNWFTGCIGGSPGRAYSPLLLTSTVVTGSTTFCTGGYVTLSANYTAGYNYQWQRNNIDIAGATDTIFNSTLGGIYTVSVSYQGCSTVSDPTTVTVVSQGQDPVVPSVYRCGPGTATLSATATDSVYWYDTPGGNVIASGPSFTTPILTATTTYYAQTSLMCPSNQIAVDVVINEYTADPIVSSPISRCGPGNILLTATDTAEVHWYNANGALVFTGDIFPTSYLPHDTTFYAEAGNLCPSDRIQVDVIITSAPVPIVSNNSLCGSGQVTLSAASPYQVSWYDSISGGSQVGSGLNFITPFLNTSTTYFAEANDGCASERIPATAIINIIPAAPVTVDSSVCGPGSVLLTANGSAQIFWYDAPVGGNLLTTGSLLQTPVINTTTVYYAEATDVCSSSRTAANAIVNPLPADPIVSGDTACGSASLTLSANSSDRIFWFNQPLGSTPLAAGNSFTTPVINLTTTYYVSADNGCRGNDIPVTAVIYPVAQVYLGNDTLLQTGQSIILNAGTGMSSYLWSTGETTQVITVNSTSNIWVNVTDANGCIDSDTILVDFNIGFNANEFMTSPFVLFPNPTKGAVLLSADFIKSSNIQLSLVDVTGQLLYDAELKFVAGKNNHEMDLSGFAKGMYFIRLDAPDFSKTLRITIE
jgi:hypothetical protein